MPIDYTSDVCWVAVCDEYVARVEVGMAEYGCTVLGEDGEFVEQDREHGFYCV